MKNITLAIIVSCIFIQCKNDSSTTINSLGPNVKNFVSSYLLVDSFSLDVISDTTLLPPEIISFRLLSESDGDINKTYAHYDSGEGKAVFYNIAKLYKDTSYNRPVSGVFSICLLDTITKISISCLEEYDQRHKAGALLNDIAMIKYYSAKEYIENGYVDPNKESLDICYSGNMKIPLEQFNTNLNYLVQPLFFISLTSSPDYTGTYVFLITIKTNGGKSFSYKTESVSLEGK